MLSHDLTLWYIVIRSLLVYLVILLGLRLTKTRVLGQGNLYDLVLVLLVSNAVQNAMVGNDYSIDGGLISLATIFLANALVVRGSLHFGWLGRLTQGEPVVLIQDGHLIAANVARQHLSWDQLDAAIREHGVDGVRDVELGVLEVDGSISILPRPPAVAGHRPHRRLRGHRRPS